MAVGTGRRSGQLHEGNLGDFHIPVQGDGQAGQVAQLQGELALPARIHEPGRGMDDQSQPAQGAFALQPGHQVGGQLDMLPGTAQDELAGVQDEGLFPGYGNGQGGLLPALPEVDGELRGRVESQDLVFQMQSTLAGWSSAGSKGRMTSRPCFRASRMERSLSSMESGFLNWEVGPLPDGAGGGGCCGYATPEPGGLGLFFGLSRRDRLGCPGFPRPVRGGGISAVPFFISALFPQSLPVAFPEGPFQLPVAVEFPGGHFSRGRPGSAGVAAGCRPRRTGQRDWGCPGSSC